ncbi:MAG: hypothetical protein U0325_24200 [Polyangiales bacterium]
MPLETRRGVVRAMRDAATGLIEEMSQRAVKETRLGRVEDKRIKNRAAITRTPWRGSSSPSRPRATTG